MSKGFTTISIKKEILEALNNLDINFHGIEMKQNSDKIQSLILLHKENLKSETKDILKTL